MAIWVQVDQGKCIGCLACTRCHNFVCGNDFKVQTVKSEIDEIGCNQEAAAICPVGAINILDPDANGKNQKENATLK